MDSPTNTSTDIYKKVLAEFVEKYQNTFDLSGLNTQERNDVVSAVMNVLQNPKESTCTTKLALVCVRILSRHKSTVEQWMSEALFTKLIDKSCLSDYLVEGDCVTLLDNMDVNVVIEATKCLCNLTFNSKMVQNMCHKHKAALALIQRAKTYSDVNFDSQLKFYDVRLLFIITALSKDSQKLACLQWNGISTFTDVMSLLISERQETGLLDEGCDLLIEILKTLYNMVLVVSPWKDEYKHLENDVRLLARVIQKIICHPCKTKEKHLELVRHGSNIFTVMPSMTAEYLVPLDGDFVPPSFPPRSHEGHNVNCLVEILRYLEIILEGTSLSNQKDQLLPTLSALTCLSKSHRIIRKFCRLIVLPHLRDEVKRLPEDGDTLRNRLCKLLTTPHTEVKQVVAEFLFVLCKENVFRLIKYSGFGNAAGLLAQYGLMGGASHKSAEYSNDSDSETEEYKELKPNVNPVTGRFELPRHNPMDEMTDEQKEYEAIQLMNAMDKLQRLGIVQPSRVGDDGRPVPVEHVLELAEGRDNVNPESDEN